MSDLEYQCPDDCFKIHIYLCTIYPEEPSPMMFFNLKLLQMVGDEGKLHVLPIWIQAGRFPHRLRRADKEGYQCQVRQMYIDRVPEGEWILVMDSDEVLFGSIWSLPDILLMVNKVESHKRPEFMSIWEMRSDMKFKLRPRLIRKKEGITYISDVMKHDYIKYVDHKYDVDECEEETSDCLCPRRNYIEVQEPIIDNSWNLDFLQFTHYKKGVGLSLVSDGILEFDNLPMNYKRISDVEMHLEETEELLELIGQNESNKHGY